MDMIGFVVPKKDADNVESIVKRASVKYQKNMLRGTSMNHAIFFGFLSKQDMLTAGRAVSYAYDGKITQAIHDAIVGPISREDAIWASWESFNFNDDEEEEEMEEMEEKTKTTVATADEIINAYLEAKKIQNEKKRKAAIDKVKKMSEQFSQTNLS